MPITLRVLPNPFAHLDHEGHPAGTFPFDPDHALGARRWVGARIDLGKGHDGQPRTRPLAQPWDMTSKANVGGRMTSVRVGSAPDQRTGYAFDLATAGHPLPESEHYARGVRHGDLIAADQATATRCGVEFIEVNAALLTAATRAIAQWTAEQGEAPPVEQWPENMRAIGEAAIAQMAKGDESVDAAPSPPPAVEPEPPTNPDTPAAILAATAAPAATTVGASS